MPRRKEKKVVRIILNVPLELDEYISDITKKLWTNKTSVYKLMLWLGVDLQKNIKDLKIFLNNNNQ